ncbi:glycosyltransferase family 2 protein [Clostridium sp. C8-1-8]|uniref:glycosyltransferase family 2 protein n=1 Tax=Clostridium sp. C8-1-8 TaxID=2698831 RepID=UPI00136905A4|nr:glycosyltransferase family 2 protein [Clostridium sp. C8-1-8]
MKENNDPFFSIVTVSYNSEKTIKDTIESVLNQSYKSYEYIIIDGSSTDKTLDIVKSYEREFQGKLAYISEKDKGIYDAMNKGINMSKGSFVGIINSDDWYESDALEKIYNQHMKDNAVDIIYGTLRVIRNEKEYGIERTNYDFLNEKMIPHPTTFIRKAVYSKEGGYNTEYRYAADYDYMLSLKDKGYRFTFTNDIIANYREGGATHTNIEAAIESINVRYNHKKIDKKRRNLQIMKIKFKSFLSL